jgi:hypothetical protein
MDAFQATLSVENDLPSGTSTSFDPVQVSFPQNDIMPQFSVLTITTMDSLPVIEATFTVKATSSDSETVTGTGVLTIVDSSDTELSSESSGRHRSESNYYEESSAVNSSETEDFASEEIQVGYGNFRALPVSQNIITLDWSSTFEKHNLLVTSYKIERKSIDETNFKVIDKVIPQFLKYSDDNLAGNTRYIYRISEMIYDDALSTSKEINATTLSYSNKAGKLDWNAPSTKDIKFVSNQEESSTDGFGGKLGTYSSNIPIQIMRTGQEQQLEISVSDNAGISAIKSVAVNMHFDPNLIQKGDTYFLYDEKSGELGVSDPLEIFGDVKVYRTYTKQEMILDFFFTPRKPTTIIDLVVSSWDDRLNSKNTILSGAFVIEGESMGSKQMDVIPNIPSNEKNPQAYFFDSEGNLQSFDAFGNPDNKVPRTVREPYFYQDDVGKSKRIDDGFGKRVAEERIKAKGILDIMMNYPIFIEPEDAMTPKSFRYPKHIGHTDRLDFDLMNSLMEEEKIKAEKYK